MSGGDLVFAGNWARGKRWDKQDGLVGHHSLVAWGHVAAKTSAGSKKAKTASSKMSKRPPTLQPF